MTYLRVILTLLIAGVVSLAAGLAAHSLADEMPCHGEGLACNIDAAIGGYAAIIFAGLGPIVLGLTLFFARTRIALAATAMALIVPLIAFVGCDLTEGWRYVGFYPYPNFRTFLQIFGPPAVTVVVQYLILRPMIPMRSQGGDAGSAET